MSDKETPFTYLQMINSGKGKDVVVNDSIYNQFLINRGLSLHIDTIAIANEINKYGGITNQMHFDFMCDLVTPRKRWAKWPKPKKHDKASLISQYYNISMRKAYDLVDLISDQQITEIEKQLKIE